VEKAHCGINHFPDIWYIFPSHRFLDNIVPVSLHPSWVLKGSKIECFNLVCWLKRDVTESYRTKHALATNMRRPSCL
jgi:hypothetical protein